MVVAVVVVVLVVILITHTLSLVVTVHGSRQSFFHPEQDCFQEAQETFGSDKQTRQERIQEEEGED